jgi:hypothetical protein
LSRIIATTISNAYLDVALDRSMNVHISLHATPNAILTRTVMGPLDVAVKVIVLMNLYASLAQRPLETLVTPLQNAPLVFPVTMENA